MQLLSRMRRLLPFILQAPLKPSMKRNRRQQLKANLKPNRRKPKVPQAPPAAAEAEATTTTDIKFLVAVACHTCVPAAVPAHECTDYL